MLTRSAPTGIKINRLHDVCCERCSGATDPGNLHESPGSVIPDASADFTRGKHADRTDILAARYPIHRCYPRPLWLPLPSNGKPHLSALPRSVESTVIADCAATQVPLCTISGERKSTISSNLKEELVNSLNERCLQEKQILLTNGKYCCIDLKKR
jgi:hypothetical protein